MTPLAVISNLVGLYHHEFHVTKEVYTNTMALLDAVLGPDDAVIFMDDAPCHVGTEHENRVVKRRITYMPFLDSTENCFSPFKAKVKRQPKSELTAVMYVQHNVRTERKICNR